MNSPLPLSSSSMKRSTRGSDPHDKHRGHSTENDEEDIVGYVKEWSLALYGTHGTRHDRASLTKERKQAAYQPSTTDMAEIKKREVELAREVKVKRAQRQQQSPDSISNQNTFQKKTNEEEEKEEMVDTLWDLLHAHGGRDVRKRVLQRQSVKREMVEDRKESDISTSAKVQELIRLTNELIAELD